MENKFENRYQEEKTIEKAFETAVKAGNSDEIKKAVEARNNWMKTCGNEEMFRNVYQQYKKFRDNGNEKMNMDVYPSDVNEFVKCLKENGVTNFTFSYDGGMTLENAMKIQKAGCKMVGLVEINDSNFYTNERMSRAAMLFEVM